MTARAITVAPSAECGGLAPYASYRDSGLPWLGDIPEHWDVRRNGRLFAERVETGFEELPILEVSLRTGVRVRDMENGARKQQMADRSKYKRAAKGDVAYNMMRMWQGAVGVAPVDGLISPAYVVARPFPEVDPRYYTYLFRTTAYMREVNKFSRGIVSDRNRLYWDEFKQMPSAFPPTEEQTRIADFLDDHGRRTTLLIRNKRRLIGLLNEQKQAIINRAVTRGLDPDAPMKPTVIDWMPEVPAHWDIAALRHRYHVDLGKMLDEKRISGDHLVRYLRNIDVQWDRINTSDLPEMDILEAEYSRYTLLPGDLLVCEGGEVGRTATWQGAEEVTGYQKALHRVRPINRAREVPRWLFYLMLAFAKRGVFAADGNENTIAHLTNEKLRAFRFPFPQAKEQQDIVSFLDQETSEIERIKSRVESEITLILEYRERLISDVVTGKLDVRHIEIAASTDEPIADEDDALDEDPEAEDTDELAEVED
jgi:type I restriction enzyme S subunit